MNQANFSIIRIKKNPLAAYPLEFCCLTFESITMIYWLTQNLADVPENDDWLVAVEYERLQTIRIPKRLADWRLGRWTGKLVVAAYFEHIAGKQKPNSFLESPKKSPLEGGQGGVTDFVFKGNSVHCPEIMQTKPPEGGTTNLLAEIEIRAAADGAPEVFLYDKPAPITLSISHSNGAAFCTAGPASQALGCDLEKVEPRSKAFIADYFTHAEMAIVEKAPPEDMPFLATLIWSAKESALKALRQGLRLDTRSVEVQIEHDKDREKWHMLSVRYENAAREFQGCWRRWGGFVQTIVGEVSTHR